MTVSQKLDFTRQMPGKGAKVTNLVFTMAWQSIVVEMISSEKHEMCYMEAEENYFHYKECQTISLQHASLLLLLVSCILL